ncbi:tetratricopeptide repeat protein [Streptomyces atriruber]|uniref:Tetratricopeptide repeat protein n=1 Tax=Streptomyces atriruber TaxID=545121 RepID=A0ABV3BMJ2_9ACTN
MQERHRTAVVRAAGQGSGHLLAPRLVLTAEHVLGGRTDATVQVPGSGPVPCRVVWSRSDEPYDTALLLAEQDLTRDLAPVRWGRLVTQDPADTWIRGYTGHSGRAGKLGSTSFVGVLDPMEAVESDRYVLSLTGTPPLGSARVSPWAGLSGGAVWCAGTLVGVAVADLPGWQHSRIEAVPSYVLFADKAFRELVRLHTGATIHLEPAEFADHAESVEPLVPRSAATLLHPRAETVRFTGRHELLGEMVAWSTAHDDLSMALLTGAGGAGKSRLARELGHRLAAHRYAVVHLRRGSGLDQHRLLAGTTAPVLLVIDYAESRVEEVGRLLHHLGRRMSGVPIRVLLVARAVGQWWEELRSLGGADAADTTAQARRWSILDTASLGVAEDEIFRTAVKDLTRGAAALGLALSAEAPGDAPPEWPGMPPRPHRTVLDIHMAALASVLAPSAQVPVRHAQEALLDHESAYWRETSRRAPIDVLGDAALRNAVVAATLVGPVPGSRAHAMLARVPRVGDHPESVRRAVADWLHELYPRPDSAEGGTSWQWGPLQPDPLGEFLVGRRVAAEPEIFLRLLPVLDGRETVNALLVLSRAAAQTESEPLADVLRTAVRSHPARLSSLLVAAGTRSAEPAILIAALDRILVEELLPRDRLLDLAARIPPLTRALSSWSVRLHEKLLQVEPDPTAANPERLRAGALHNLAGRQLAAHHYEEALEAATSGLRLLDTGGVGDSLVRGLLLHDRAAALGGLGRAEEAVRDGRLSVTQFVTLQVAGGRDQSFAPHGLGAVLNNLSQYLAETGDDEAALAAARSSVRTRRELAAHDATLLPDLARSLNTLTLRLHEAGDLTEAMEAADESLSVRRTAAQDHPDAYLEELTSTLNNRARVLVDLGDLVGALEDVREEASIRRQLAHSGQPRSRVRLVRTLHRLADLSLQAGSPSKALEAADEATGLARRLVVEDGRQHLPLLGGAFLVQTRSLIHASRASVAYRVNSKAAQVFRTVHRENPADFIGLLDALGNQARFMSAAKRPKEEEQAAAEIVALLTGLPEELRDELRENLAAAHEYHAGTLLALNRPAAAREACDAALALYQQLEREDPGRSLTESIAGVEALRESAS